MGSKLETSVFFDFSLVHLDSFPPFSPQFLFSSTFKKAYTPEIMETGSPSCSLNHKLVQTKDFEKHEAPFVSVAVEEGRMHQKFRRPRMTKIQYLNLLMAEYQKSGGRCGKQSVDNWSVDEPSSVESKSEVARVHNKARRVEIGNGVPNSVHVRAYSKGNLGERNIVTDKSFKQSVGNNPSQLDFRFAESSSKSDNEIRKCRAKKCDSRLPTMDAKKNHIHVGDARAKVQKARSMFRSVFKALMSEENEGNSGNVTGKKIKRFDLKSAEILKRDNYWVNSGLQIVGTVPGVEVGDEYHYRVELAIVGLHRHYESGIDYMNEGGRILATSIVASGVYADYMYNSGVLVYYGQGGNPQRERDSKIANDQKLERGNLALKNSMLAKRPVRVIRGFNEAKGHQTLLARLETDATLVYDGLYMVERFWEEQGAQRNIIFKYQLRRITGQPEIKLFKTMNRRNFL